MDCNISFWNIIGLYVFGKGQMHPSSLTQGTKKSHKVFIFPQGSNKFLLLSPLIGLYIIW